MKLKYTILYVADVRASLDFYAAAFGLGRRMLHESGDYGELDTGATTLAFASRQLLDALGKAPGTPDPAHPVFEIAFETDDVPAAHDRAVTAGARSVQPPQVMPWGQTTAYVRDRDGFLVELCTPVAPLGAAPDSPDPA